LAYEAVDEVQSWLLAVREDCHAMLSGVMELTDEASRVTNQNLAIS
jgi:hypothetical protein